MTALLPLLVGLATFAVVVWVRERRLAVGVGRRVAEYVAPRRVTLPGPDEQVLASRYERTLAASERGLERLPFWTRFATLCERADAPLRPAALFWAAGLAFALVGLLGFAVGHSAFVALVLVLVGVAALRFWLGSRISHRRRVFEEQLPELLLALGSALRAGHGLTQALQAVASDAPEPVAGELGRVLAEARLGRSLDDALTDLGGRIDSRELDFVLDAIIVQRQVGGSLAGIFDIVGESVRQRQQFALRLRALTAMGRASALVLLALPIGLAGVLSLLNHAYLAPLVQLPIGRFLLVASFLLLAVGCVWLRKIVSYRG